MICTWYLAKIPLVIFQNGLKFRITILKYHSCIYAKYHYNSCYYLYKLRANLKDPHNQWAWTSLNGEGKRPNEFAEWHVAWLTEWHNYAECKICRMTKRNKLNRKLRPLLAPINSQVAAFLLLRARLRWQSKSQERLLDFSWSISFFYLALLVGLLAAPILHHESRTMKKRCFRRSRSLLLYFFLQKIFARLKSLFPPYLHL